jgi:hypothetical protein
MEKIQANNFGWLPLSFFIFDHLHPSLLKKYHALSLGIIAFSFVGYGQFNRGDYDQPAVPFDVFNDGSVNFNPIVGDKGTFLWFTRTGHEQNTGGLTDQDIWFQNTFRKEN